MQLNIDTNVEINYNLFAFKNIIYFNIVFPSEYSKKWWQYINAHFISFNMYCRVPEGRGLHQSPPDLYGQRQDTVPKHFSPHL